MDGELGLGIVDVLEETLELNGRIRVIDAAK
jgi:hypothetical protein